MFEIPSVEAISPVCGAACTLSVDFANVAATKPASATARSNPGAPAILEMLVCSSTPAFKSIITNTNKQKNKNLGQQPERRLNKLIHVWEQNKNCAQPGNHRSSSRQNKSPENRLVAEPIPNHPQSEGNQDGRRQIMGKRPRGGERRQPSAEK